MATHSHHNISIIEAVETLSSIVEYEEELVAPEVSKKEVVVDGKTIRGRKVLWLNEGSAPETVNLIKDAFWAVLNYLKRSSKKEKWKDDRAVVESIKMVMVLVGEAAKKMDRYLSNIKGVEKITSLEEYKALQEFYGSKIAVQLEEGTVAQWVLGLTLGKGSEGRALTFQAIPKPIDEPAATSHIFMDLDAVKKDSEYELFFIKKEDGSPFYNSRLLRSMKLASDFGHYISEKQQIAPLIHAVEWEDGFLRSRAKAILGFLGKGVDAYFKEIRRAGEGRCVKEVGYALVALMLAAGKHNLIANEPVKSCSKYFEDFLHFLREALLSDEYGTLIVTQGHSSLIMELIQKMCFALYFQPPGIVEARPIVKELMEDAIAYAKHDYEEAMGYGKKVADRLVAEHIALQKLLANHSNGPLNKIFNQLQKQEVQGFDPLRQHNLSWPLFDMSWGGKKINIHRLPSPIVQEVINKAKVVKEFEGALMAGSNHSDKLLLINMHNRTEWRDHGRSVALEDLQYRSPFDKTLTVVTLAIDTDFYHQLPPYHIVNHAHTFMNQFKEMILDEGTGYFFPSAVKHRELSHFIDQAFESIHKVFFVSKNVLTLENRLDFIEIFCALLQLKLIEWIAPTKVALSCKDGLDVSESFGSGLYLFLNLLTKEEITEEMWENFNAMLYGPALIVRERLILNDWFERMKSALQVIENARAEMGWGAFSELVTREIGKLYQAKQLPCTIVA